jgi:hypothetical protein
MPDFSQFKAPTPRSFLPENVDTYVPPASARSDRPVSANDLVDSQGMCAGMAPPAPPPPPPGATEGAPQGTPAAAQGAAPGAAPAVVGTVGLDMSECEVVQALGRPQSVNIGTGERGQREVTMIYMGSEKAGTYLFRNGRLNSLERGPEPPPSPAAEKAKKKKPVAKKKPAPNQPS